jgi:hypothetical protein
MGYGSGCATPIKAVSRKHGKQIQLMPQNQLSQKAPAAPGRAIAANACKLSAQLLMKAFVSARFKTIAILFGIKNQLGFSNQEIESAEHSVGELPQLLREYYLELGTHEELNSTQDYLAKARRFTAAQTGT